MTSSNLSKLLGASAIAASLAVLPLNLPAQAQNTAPDTTSETSTQRNGDVQSADTNADDDFNLGWLGLLGLAGLAGLAGKKHRETVHHINRDPDVVVRPGSDYR
jgi:LPXTG-motif cell wall-anchored protein